MYMYNQNMELHVYIVHAYSACAVCILIKLYKVYRYRHPRLHWRLERPADQSCELRFSFLLLYPAVSAHFIIFRKQRFSMSGKSSVALNAWNQVASKQSTKHIMQRQSVIIATPTSPPRLTNYSTQNTRTRHASHTLSTRSLHTTHSAPRKVHHTYITRYSFPRHANAFILLLEIVEGLRTCTAKELYMNVAALNT